MRVFLDTEFSPFDLPRLLSVGMVADDGHGRTSELYIELAGDAYLPDASEFVLDMVAPQLGIVPHKVVSVAEIGRRAGEWLRELAAELPLEVAYDYHTDLDLLEDALKQAGLREGLKDGLVPTHVGYVVDEPEPVDASNASWSASFAADGVGRHHALADALALRAASVAVHGR